MSTQRAAAEVIDRRESNITPLARIGFGLYLIVLAIALGAMMLYLWRGGTLETEFEFMALALTAGAFGSFIHIATSFAMHTAEKDLDRSWMWWYVLRPFVGASLALITYFLIRGGLLVPNIVGVDGQPGVEAQKALSPFGIAAISGLVGMFSNQATNKLGEIFTTVFATRNEENAPLNGPVSSAAPPESRDDLLAGTGGTEDATATLGEANQDDDEAHARPAPPQDSAHA